ncbi:hypothetical protein NJR55_11270 [Idiomarina sp. M1R2S28]|uniref:Secreted protein n=1 Tax=Idiomarina rhizosphaerae TaxID=2961572 RepID=A0A9X2FW66_9GAMM|nr:hypothetical protein [Idiomarina rhizosphaerae]MCP1340166.1 hypothetical protein [Idiomarina rhizosphaerae]
MKIRLSILTLLLGTALSHTSVAQDQVIKPAPMVSTQAQAEFFAAINKHCGNSYAGEVTVDTPKSEGFEGDLVMHVRKCGEQRIEIPFHVGDNHSRTWILTQTGSGISLKHDHRKPDGNYDPLTMYGGHTTDKGYATAQSFPVDAYSKELFIELGVPQSNTNTWQMYIHDKTFTYRLVREGREFRVDFDLTEPVETPATPWGYAD